MGDQGLPRGRVLVGDDGEDELLSARLWMGTYNPGDEGEDEATVKGLGARLIAIGADIFTKFGIRHSRRKKTSGWLMIPPKTSQLK